ncbi:hypothetical protein [Streptomyces osmaniensis]|uniref:Uncharacterized protein n=1 Tax=Streptomyces osmaniensis TaxID=593134 RepID=A0ABP6YUI2_9ACTN|nr:hypothetical protein KJK32_05090 [Streptomyces sp. JCM17656]
MAENFLTEPKLRKLERPVGRLCLRTEDIADDDLSLSRPQRRNLVELELAMASMQLAA